MLRVLVIAAIFGVIHGSIIQRNLFPSSRIIGGQDAPEGAIPYQVSLRAGGSHFCGGCILNDRWILTAAHCTEGDAPFSFSVVVGTNSLLEGGASYYAEKIILHEDYDSEELVNDISLVKVNRRIQFNRRVQPIPLPKRHTVAGAKLILSGWGRTDYRRTLPNQLQMLNLTAISLESCRQRFKGYSDIHTSQICSLTKAGEGSCEGDSGGPLVEAGRVVGVVSWGMPCARGYPDVYTRVHSFRDWILAAIDSN